MNAIFTDHRVKITLIEINTPITPTDTPFHFDYGVSILVVTATICFLQRFHFGDGIFISALVVADNLFSRPSDLPSV